MPKPAAPLSLSALLASDWQHYRTLEGDGSALSPLTDLGFWICATYRFGNWARGVRVPLVGKLLRLAYRLFHFAVFVLSGSDIRAGAVIGQRFTIHTYPGLVIGDDAVIGDDCAVFTGVGIVHRANDKGSGLPVIGNNVKIGTGSKVMGNITIGDGVRIGANAVVIRDVPADHMAVGVPAVNKPIRAPQPEAPNA